MSPNSKVVASHLCPQCYLPQRFCYCAQIPKVYNKNWVSLVIHIAEVGRISNTGLALIRALENADAYTVGKINTPKFSGINQQAGHTPVMLVHDLSAPTIAQYKQSVGDKLLQLVILDGTWNQTRRMLHHNTTLYSLPKVSIANRNSNYLLRDAPQVGALSTIEAVACALEELEGISTSQPLFELLEVIKESVFKCNPVRRPSKLSRSGENSDMG